MILIYFAPANMLSGQWQCWYLKGSSVLSSWENIFLGPSGVQKRQEESSPVCYIEKLLISVQDLVGEADYHTYTHTPHTHTHTHTHII